MRGSEATTIREIAGVLAWHISVLAWMYSNNRNRLVDGRTCAAGALGLESFVHGALLVRGAQGAVAVG